MLGKITSYKYQNKGCTFLTDKNLKINLKVTSRLDSFFHFNKNDCNFLGKMLKGISITDSNRDEYRVTPFDVLNKETTLNFRYIYAIVENNPNDIHSLLYTENKGFSEDYPEIRVNVEFMEKEENVW